MRYIPKGADGMTMTSAESGKSWRSTPGYITNGVYDYAKMYEYFKANPDKFDMTRIRNLTSYDWGNLFGTNAKRNDKGYADFNTLFNQSGLNEFFGYDSKVADLYGPSTASRKGFLDYIANKQREEEAASTQQPVTASSTPAQTGTTQTETPQTQTPTVTPHQLSFDSLTSTPKQPGWSDWIALGSQLGNDLYNNRQQELLQSEMKFPKKSYSSPDYLMDNGFFTRSLLNKQANQIRSNATRNLSSNAEYNFAVAGQAEDAASKLNLEAARIKAERTAQEKMNFHNVLEQRKAGQTEAANFNTMQSAAAWNNSLNATQKRLERDNASLNSYIGNMTTSLGEYLKTKRLNENNLMRAQAKEQLSKSYNNRLAAYQNDQDITKWKDFGGLYDAMMTAGGWGDDEEMGTWKRTWAEQGSLDANQLAKVNAWLMTDAGAEWRAKWSDYLDKRQRQFYDEVNGDQLAYETTISRIPAYVTNQFGWSFPDKRRNITLKQGGTIDKLSNFTRQYMQEQQHVRKSQDTRNQTLQRSLSQQLERLSREQLILLRSVFK